MATTQKAYTAATKSAKSFNDVVKSVSKDRFKGLKRNYTPEQVMKLRGSVLIENTLATMGANKLWNLLHKEPYVHCLGAYTGSQAVQMSRAGLHAIYLSGWQVAAEANSAGQMYPDQSLYPVNSGPDLCRRMNNAMLRADQIESVDGINTDGAWIRPIVADAEAGFGGSLNCYELMRAYISAGASGVHFEDQLGSEKKCGHMGGKVLIPTSEHIRHLNAARLGADVSGVPTVLVSRTDAESAMLLTSDIDERDQEFIDTAAGRTEEGFYRLKKGSGVQNSIKRSLAYAPFSDLLWMETSTPNLEMAKIFAEAIRKEFPDKLLAYNCSPSFNWSAHLSPKEISVFLQELGKMGYKFQFITLAGFHLNNFGSFDLARNFKLNNMTAYTQLQDKEFAAQKDGYTAVKHQKEVGTSYFDLVASAVSGGHSSTTALAGSTESDQFQTGLKAASTQPQMKEGTEKKEETQIKVDKPVFPPFTSHDPSPVAAAM